jgi:hypothetical protein
MAKIAAKIPAMNARHKKFHEEQAAKKAEKVSG